MFAWLLENIATVLICAVLVAVVAAIIFSMVKNRKKGCGCANCPMSGSCHPEDRRVSKK